MAEGAGNRLSVWSKNTQEGDMPLTSWGNSFRQEGNHLSLTNPKGLAFDPTENILYIADSGRQRIVALHTVNILFTFLLLVRSVYLIYTYFNFISYLFIYKILIMVINFSITINIHINISTITQII